MNRSHWYFLPIVAGLVVGSYFLGRHLGRQQGAAAPAPGPAPAPSPTPDRPPQPAVVGAVTQQPDVPGPGPANPPEVPMKPKPEAVVVAVGEKSKADIVPADDRPKAPPKAVGNKVRIRQNFKPGKTYETFTRGTIFTKGNDRAWGLKSLVSINYAFEARIDRQIVSNDGEAIVERRHFRDVKSVKIDVELEDLKLDVSGLGAPILALASYIWPDAPFAVRSFDGISLAPVLSLLRAFGVRPERFTGHDSEAIKIFAQFDSLQGKSIEIEYRDGQGVTQVVPLVGAMTRSERFVHYHSVLVSDSLIFPNPEVAENEAWTVDGASFSNLIDPGLRAAVGGEVTMRRARDLDMGGKSVAVLKAEGGTLRLTSAERGRGEIGWFEPRGTMRFSPEDQIIVEASLTGKGQLDWVGPTHLLFKTEMRHAPEITAFYTCRVVDTPAGGGR
jgi:hypothetical protein